MSVCGCSVWAVRVQCVYVWVQCEWVRVQCVGSVGMRVQCD